MRLAHLVAPSILVAIGSTAMAQPKPRPAAKVPMRSVPCLPQDATLHATNGDAVICWDKGCMKLDFENTDATWIVKPPEQKRFLMPQAELKGDQVCVGTTCKRLGKKLLAALAAGANEPDGPAVKATTDLKAVVIGHDQVWSVASDSKLKLTAPKLYARTGEKPAVSGIDVAGELLVISWSTCAGPCTKFSLADSAGRPKGAEGDGGGEVFQLDAKRFAVVSEYAAISLFELGTGKPRGSIRLGASPEQNFTVRGDDTTIFTLFGKNDGAQVTKVTAYDDKSLALTADQSMFLPSCKP